MGGSTRASHQMSGDPTATGDFVYMVHFKRSHQYFLVDANNQSLNISTGNYVIVEADRGVDVGIVGDLVPSERFWAIRFAAISKKTLKHIIRLATKDEVCSLITKTSDEIVVTQICQELLLTTHPLPIDILDAEYQYDRNKLTIHHDSSKRCDFRSYVRDLFCIFKTRIWMQRVDRKHEMYHLSTNTTPEHFERITFADSMQQSSERKPTEIVADPVLSMLHSQTLQQPNAPRLTTDTGFYNDVQQVMQQMPQMSQMQPDPLGVQQALMSELQVQVHGDIDISQVGSDMQDLATTHIDDASRSRKSSPPLQNLSNVVMNQNGDIIINGQGALSIASPSMLNLPMGTSSDNLTVNFDSSIADLALRNELSTLAAERDSIYRDQHMNDIRMNEIQMEEERLTKLKHANVKTMEQHLQLQQLQGE